MKDNNKQALLDVATQMGQVSDWCHNNINSKTWEDWEKMHKQLLDWQSKIRLSVGEEPLA